MKMNKGAAMSMSLVMMPNTLDGSVSSRAGSKTPDAVATAATSKETPANVKATG